MIDWIKRVIFRQDNLLKHKAIVNNKVCMVVWNTFETDARVTKEATTLIRSGKKVRVVAVHQPGRTERQEILHDIMVIRVDRTVKKQSAKTKSVNASNETIKSPVAQYSLKSRMRKKFQFVPKLIINIRFFLEAYKQDAGVYHAHDLNTLIPVYLATRLRGALLVYDAHEVSTDRAGWSNKALWEKIEGFLIKKADKVITTNLTRAEYFQEAYRIPLPNIIKNVPPFEKVVSTNKLRKTFLIPNDEPVILYQGGIQRDRGLENMIKMVPLLNRGKLVFLGNGRLKPELIRLVDDMNLNEKVFFMDAVPNKDLLSYTSSATIGLQLLINSCFNHYSACSNKLNEYMMAGIPVVASDLPEIKRTIDEFETGILVDPENLEQIADAINTLLTNTSLYQSFKVNTSRAAAQNKWENEESVLLNIYNF